MGHSTASAKFFAKRPAIKFLCHFASWRLCVNNSPCKRGFSSAPPAAARRSAASRKSTPPCAKIPKARRSFYSHPNRPRFNSNASPALGGLHDGSGSWDFTTADWWNGSTNVVWNNATLPALTSFGVTNGPAGTVTLGAAITVSNLCFNPASSGNYTIAAGSGGGPLTFVNGSTVTVATNCFPVISAPVTGTNFIYVGPGTLTLSGNNTLTAALTRRLTLIND